MSSGTIGKASCFSLLSILQEFFQYCFLRSNMLVYLLYITLCDVAEVLQVGVKCACNILTDGLQNITVATSF